MAPPQKHLRKRSRRGLHRTGLHRKKSHRKKSYRKKSYRRGARRRGPYGRLSVASGLHSGAARSSRSDPVRCLASPVGAGHSASPDPPAGGRLPGRRWSNRRSGRTERCGRPAERAGRGRQRVVHGQPRTEASRQAGRWPDPPEAEAFGPAPTARSRRARGREADRGPGRGGIVPKGEPGYFCHCRQCPRRKEEAQKRWVRAESRNDGNPRSGWLAIKCLVAAYAAEGIRARRLEVGRAGQTGLGEGEPGRGRSLGGTRGDDNVGREERRRILVRPRMIAMKCPTRCRAAHPRAGGCRQGGVARGASKMSEISKTIGRFLGLNVTMPVSLRTTLALLPY